MSGPTSSRAWDNPDAMLGVDEALERILAAFAPLPAVEVPLLDALGLVLAEDIVANENVPPFRNSAMDGFALRAADTRAATRGQPVALSVAGLIAAGDAPSVALQSGQAARIMTGAPLPAGADAVARFEETRLAGDDVLIERAIPRQENVREAGEDIRAGETVMRAGTALRPAHIGLLAALDRERVHVRRRPRVAILATGDEVVDLGGGALRPGQIRNSNSYTVAALVRRAGGLPQLLGVARDATDDLTAKLAAAERPDLLVTSGGVSVGDYDMVKDVLRARGRVDIWQVRMKPGKPLAFGALDGTPLLGLPGNPMAALVSFEQFGRPAIRRMLGHAEVRLPEVEATLAEPMSNAGRRRHFVRGYLTPAAGGFAAHPAPGQGSGKLTPLARGNCLIVIPETCEHAPAGMQVRAQLLDCDVV